MNQGWSCPKCQRVWGPHVAACAPCNQTLVGPYVPTSIPQWRPPNTAAAPSVDLSYRHQGGDTA